MTLATVDFVKADPWCCKKQSIALPYLIRRSIKLAGSSTIKIRSSEKPTGPPEVFEIWTE